MWGNDRICCRRRRDRAATSTEHRLYQADWLLRYYQFEASELLSEEHPNFNIWLDPKCDWALRHLDVFPMGEINRADFFRTSEGAGDRVQIQRFGS